MIITKRHLSRRTVLKGMGVTVALPFLEAMTPAATALANTAAKGKVRFVAIEMVHGAAGSTTYGAKNNLWAPAAVGRSFDLAPTSLAPLEPVRDYVTIVSNTDVRMATPFRRAAYGADVDAMKLLVSYGADPAIPTVKPVERPETGDVGRRAMRDVSGLLPVPVGGPGVPPLPAAAGAGFGEGFAGNSHRHAPGGMLAAVKYLVDELGADVNARDHEGNTAVHHAASRGDTEMVRYLVTKGADVTAVNREGQTTVDMANGPVQRVQPWPDTIKFLESLGAKNNHKCMSC